MINIISGINENENRTSLKEVNDVKIWFSERINKKYTLLIRMIKNEIEKTQVTNNKTEWYYIPTDGTESKKIS